MPRRSKFVNPYHQALKWLNRHQVRYLLVGVSAINYYASKPINVLLTADFDVFLRPVPDNLFRAI